MTDKKEFRKKNCQEIYVVLCVVELNNGGVQVEAKRPCLVEVREEVPGGRCVAGMGREESLLACWESGVLKVVLELQVRISKHFLF